MIALLIGAALAEEPTSEPLPVTTEHRGLIVGLPELATRLESLDWQRDAEHIEASRLADGTIDILYTYEPSSKDGQVDYLHHNVLMSYYRPSKAPDPADLELGLKVFARTLDWEHAPIEPSPLGWGQINLCYAINKRNGGAPTGTLCGAVKDRFTVIYAVDGLILREAGSVDALLHEALDRTTQIRR